MSARDWLDGARARVTGDAVTARTRLWDARDRWRQTWSPTVTVGAEVVITDRSALAEEPRLRRLMDDDLRTKIEATHPWRWRYDDARLHLANAVRALRGHEPVERWRYVIEVTLHDDAEFFERGWLTLQAVKRRVPA